MGTPRGVPTAREAEDFARWVRRTLRRRYPGGLTEEDSARLLAELGTIESCAALLADLEPQEPPPRFLADDPRQSAKILRMMIDRLTRDDSFR